MTIKQQGGVFGRNPTFHSVETDGGDVLLENSTGTSPLLWDADEATLFIGSQSGSAKNGNTRLRLQNTNAAYMELVSTTTAATGVLMGDTDDSFRGGIVYDNNVDELRLWAGNASRAVINSSGNIVLNSGGGIDFSATAGTGTSELFDDYEEGTFTPDIVGSVSAGTGTYAYRLGRYTKIGDRVLFNLIMSWSAHTGTGFMRIGGLPFTSMASSPYYHAVNIGFVSNLATTAGTVPAGFVLNNSTQIWMGEIPTGGGAWAYMGIDTAGDLNISGQYEV